MKFTLDSSLNTECLVLAIDSTGKLLSTPVNVQHLVDDQIKLILSRNDLAGELGKSLLVHLPHNHTERLLLVNCGDQSKLTAKKYHQLLEKIVQKLKYYSIKKALFTLHHLDTPELSLYWKVRESVLAIHDGFYLFDACKSQKAEPSTLQEVVFFSEAQDQATISKGIKEGSAIATGIHLCKDLSNMPPNICTPTYLADQAVQLGKKHSSLKVSHLDEAEMRKLGMGSLLSVSQGSDQPPKLIIVEYQGPNSANCASQKPIVIIGKGITFDTGGYDLKPAAGMADMKYDMCGAATVLALMHMTAELQLPIHLVGVIAASENLVNGKASRPSDIVTSMSGKTIEILNTDAEGRLVLCDALTYAKRFNPKTVIDVATLTGAAIIALGAQTNTLFSNHQPLADALLKAGKKANDPAWQLPMTDEAYDYLKSNHADLANVRNYSDTTARCIQGACFLSYFAEEYQWAHLDVAGTAMVGGKDKHATGRPIPLLAQYLLDAAYD